MMKKNGQTKFTIEAILIVKAMYTKLGGRQYRRNSSKTKVFLVMGKSMHKLLFKAIFLCYSIHSFYGTLISMVRHVVGFRC